MKLDKFISLALVDIINCPKGVTHFHSYIDFDIAIAPVKDGDGGEFKIVIVEEPNQYASRIKFKVNIV